MDHASQPTPTESQSRDVLLGALRKERRIHYERRRPEDTVLYQLVQEHLETFLAQVEAETGTALPEFVKAEFEAFLECGILAHGFLRLRCGAFRVIINRRMSWRGHTLATILE